MKKMALLLCTIMLLSGPALAHHEEGSVHDISIKVNGLVCDFCARSLEKLFGRQESVSDIHIDLGQGFIDLDLKESQSLSDDTIRSIVTNAGFEVEAITHDGKI